MEVIMEVHHEGQESTLKAVRQEAPLHSDLDLTTMLMNQK